MRQHFAQTEDPETYHRLNRGERTPKAALTRLLERSREHVLASNSAYDRIGLKGTYNQARPIKRRTLCTQGA